MSDNFYDMELDKDRFSEKVGGGIPKGSIIYIEGPDGAGKSVLSQRITYGLCENDSYVSYVTPEESSASFLNQMRSLSYDVSTHILRERLLFLHADLDTGSYLAEGGSEREIFPNLMQASVMWRADVIILDSFGEMLRQSPRFDKYYDKGQGDHALQNFITFLQKVTQGDKTVILTVDDEAFEDKRTIQPLRNIATVYLKLQSERMGSDVQRQMEVKRYKEMKQGVDDFVMYTIQPGVGLTIENRSIA